MNSEELTSERCIWRKMLADLGFEHPCEEYCFRCHYVPDRDSWTDVRVCAIYDGKSDIPTKHIEQVSCSEKLDKDTFMPFREWQIRMKIIEHNNLQHGIQDISFERWQKERECKMELATRPKVHVTFSAKYCSLKSIIAWCQQIIDAGCWPIATIE